MAKKAVSTEDELRKLAMLGRRMRQLQKHVQKVRGADREALARMEEEFDELVAHAIEGRTLDLPFCRSQAEAEASAS